MKEKTRALFDSGARLLQKASFQATTKQRPQDFTRHRKMGFLAVWSVIFNMVRCSSQIELDAFRRNLMPQEANITTYRKQSFAEARQKLLPEAFTRLNDAFIQRFYADDDYHTFHGFRLMAVDGSVIELPNTPALRTAYGEATGTEGFAVARARASHLYDVENHLVIHAVLNRYDCGERDLALAHLQALRRLLPRDGRTLWILDRGYPSLAFIHALTQERLFYLMRVPSTFVDEVLGTTEPDATVTIRITKERARHLKAQGTPVPVGTVLTVRVIKVVLPTGTVETLVSNVGAEVLPYAVMPPLYFKRWGEETHYSTIKEKLEIENFSGTTPRVIAQDYHATVLLANMAAVIEHDALESWAETRDQRHLKYEAYKINTNMVMGNMKNQLIALVLEDDPHTQQTAYDALIRQLSQYFVPIIPHRSYPRRKGRKSNKYSPAKRRCL